MNQPVFIVLSVDGFNEESIEGVFFDLESALHAGRRLGGRRIEEWNGEQFIQHHSIK